MIKCFLSHSSSDKSSYIRHVVQNLDRESYIYDEITFEAGMEPGEEIVKGLEDSSLFVLFLSNNALDSEWVQQEIKLAKQLEDNGNLKRIFPIIIDKEISYTDPRIPQWMKNTKNIQHIQSPKIAARKIRERLRELSKSLHPNLKERSEIFVGRNEKEKIAESRFDDFLKEPVITFIVSGLPSIGRKAFINHTLKKSNIIKDYYSFLMISLEMDNSIEDFILKIMDLGFSTSGLELNLLNKTIEEKIDIAIEILKYLSIQNERLLIEDIGVIVESTGQISTWFQKITEKLKYTGYLTFCIASKFKPHYSIQRDDAYFCLDIPELSPNERNGLLKRYSDFNNLNLGRDDLLFFSDLLTGFPEQIFYTVDLIKHESLFEAKRKSHTIQEYASEKAKIIIADLESEPDTLDLLYLLAKFEFISYDFLFNIVDENRYYPILENFLYRAICERIGSNGDYLRVNNVIREYILRNNFETKKEFNQSLKSHVEKLLAQDQLEEKDLSDINFTVQTALMQGTEIPSKLLIPSYFLKTIIKLYNSKGTSNYRECIKLADKILESSKYMDEVIIQRIHFVKCQSLARLKEKTLFFDSVRFVNEPNRSFLHGFFNRLTGRLDDAIASYLRVLEKKPNDVRVEAELVLLYMQKDMHSEAFNLAKSIYNKYPNNVVHANNYLSCLLHKNKQEIDKELINEIINKLETNGSDRAIEMSMSAKAQMLAKEGRYSSAYDLLRQTISQFPSITYPRLTFAELAIQEKNIPVLKEAIELLESTTKYDQTHRSYIKYKAILLTLTDKFSDAVNLVEKELKDNTSSEYIKEILMKVEAFKY
ncbi:TIR domain-containing protein [Acinetobacter baumannii]|uniref:TIR domain-containing protein n=1 Tax=Acinetobacter baumannii TaxID=470 RepID=UPI0024DE7FDE|nr:TIR domain-containing protein [Acinetobacter baumannii]MDK2170869.1 TIR domain-containing protein [Acinetobacter baumannii]MDK2181675.1 TIR domain-containing protein [Acinetobacter baumannii]MDK2327513.1 TIR domain-containing protein [Acinetobacter baumannii]